MKFKPTIGLEIHVELKTKSKMFCSCPNDPEEKRANVNVCPVCLAHPGTLPVINKEAVRKVIKTGISLHCEVASFSRFDRKNYFYPDLPKGYQITQYDFPLCKNGFLEIKGHKIRIRRIHLEEDTGRLIHLENESASLVDFNRAGVPLMELVTEPDINSPEEAREFAKELQLILRYLDVSEADMEKGQMRVEANISLSKDKNLGSKAEIKNLNSFRAVERALNYEIERQTEILRNGQKVSQETRGWDSKEGRTVTQREKEEAKDYRYFPEPDLPPLEISNDFVVSIKKEIPELPQNKRERFKREYKISPQEIEVFIHNKGLSDYFEKVISELIDWLESTKKKVLENEKERAIRIATNYILTDLQGLMRQNNISEKELRITPENFAEFVTLLYEKKISSKMAKKILKEMFDKGADPSQIIEEKNLSQIVDEKEIEEILDRVILENEKAVKDIKSGKKEGIQFLIGKAMALSKGRLNPQLTKSVLEKKLKTLDNDI